MRRFVATLFAVAFLSAAFIPLVNASTETTFNGDVIINGAFQNAALQGYPRKGNDPATAWAAYDWVAETTKDDAATPTYEGANGTWVVGDEGITITKIDGLYDVGIQQYFNGSFATTRYDMDWIGGYVIASAPQAGTYLSYQVRYTDADGARQVASTSFALTSTPTKYSVGDVVPASALGLVGVRLLTSGVEMPVVVERVAAFATNGVEGRNLHILPAGDDVVTQKDVAAILSPGADGKFTFVVGMADDAGAFLPTMNAWICAYDQQTAIDDQGYPANSPNMCADAFLQEDSAAITKTRVGDAFRFDIQASALAPQLSGNPAIAIYATVEVEGAYDVETSATASREWKSGYFHLGRLAADAVDIGVSNEFYGATPVFVDSNTDGVPDYVQSDELDGYSVIITPRRAVSSPLATIVGADPAGFYEFEVSVFGYEGATGSAMTLDHCITFALFNGSGLVNGGQFDADPFWASECDAAQSIMPGGQSILVKVPASEMPAGPVGAWAFYDVEQPYRWNLASEPYGGYSQSATDFYSVARNAVKEHAVADALRVVGTPILFDSAGATSASTTVIRMDAEADELTPLDGTIVVSDGGDGAITFEYALVDSNGVRVPTEHALAIYDAAGAISDDLQPGTASQMEHAEWTGVGVLQDDGWFRVDVPVSAFDDAQGPVGAWAFAHDATSTGLVCCSTWYNPLKASIAALHPSVADAALYAPTPIVIVDDALGIPKSLASALNGVGTGVFSFTNPLVNPGFEADLLVEGRRDTTDNTGATMSSPPWFFRLDDGANGGQQPTNPKSTHEVAAGAGRLGDSALKIRYSVLDNGKGLMLGQLLGVEGAGSGLVSQGATGAAFDVKTSSNGPVTFTVSLRWLDASDVVQQTFATKTVQPSAQWQRPSFTLNVPAEGRLLGFYIAIDPASTATLYVDNVVLQGAKTALGDSRTDLSDGYAMIIEPRGLNGLEQSLIEGAGELGYYLYDVSVVDYTAVSPSTLVTAELAKSFGLRGPDALAKDLGTILQVRGADDTFVAALPASEAPATPAAPWAWVRAGDAYSPFGAPYAMQPASGYYSPVKNALAGASFADQLDYAGTPVRFGSAVAQSILGEQQISLAPAPGGGWMVRIEADTPFVETTTVTLSRPGIDDQTFPVTLATESGDLVPGLLISEETLAATTIRSADSLFTTGDLLVAGTPSATWQVCRAALDGCIDSGIESGEDLLFRAIAVNPSGEDLVYVWKFGDGTTRTTTLPDVTHSYSTPGEKIVNLTVQTPSGKKGWYESAVQVNNLLPSILGIDVSPTPVNTDDLVTIRARATDRDGGSIVYTWKIDGVVVPDAAGPSLRLTEEVLLATTFVPTLELRTYDVAVSIVDGQGSPPLSGTTAFTVVPRAPELSAATLAVVGVEGATYALPGETVLVSVAVSDGDAQATGVFLRAVEGTLDELALLETAPGVFTGSFVPTAPTALVVRAAATTLAGDVLGPSAAFDVLADTLPVLTISGPTLVQSGESATFSASAVDPDGRTLGDSAWTIDGVAATPDAEGNVTETFSGMGFRTIEVAVDGATASLVLAVDDAITVSMTIVDAGETPTDGNLIQVIVRDQDGNAVEGARVVVDDYAALLPVPVQSRTVTTDEDGQATFRMAPEGAGLLALPVEHRLVATATADSAEGAPESGDETASVETSYDNLAGPYALTLLP